MLKATNGKKVKSGLVFLIKNERLETYAVNCLIDIVPVKIVNKIRSIEDRFSHEISIKYKNARIFLEYLLENSILIKKVD